MAKSKHTYEERSCVICHRDGDQLNNQDNNLQVLSSRAEHKKIHYEAEKYGLMMLADSWNPSVEGLGC